MADQQYNMEYKRLGKSGLKVSRLCLGCMSFGSSKWADWVLDEKDSLPIIKRAYELGINFFDTADVYSNGESERILGRAIKEIGAPRSNFVIATKVYYDVSPDITRRTVLNPRPIGPDTVNNKGLSRKHIFEACEASLKRLQTDYIDLYQIHRFDETTPIEETMCALNDLVRSGKVRYIGASSMYAWQFSKAQYIAEINGWEKFVSMQNVYNLIYREEEREMIPLCVDMGVGLIPWSPLAKGTLAGKNRQTKRQETDKMVSHFYNNNQDEAILDREIEIAKKKNVLPVHIALAWLYSKDIVASPIVGCNSIEKLEQLIGAWKVKLDEDEIKYLQELYNPKKIVGHS
jgi:aryl-alcohol dehydrogenase-like predicted oxidoreductase